MKKTRVIVQMPSKDPPFLRGEGVSSLNWEKGVPLEPIGPNEWVWETEENFLNGEFKILIRDKTLELGDNHPLYPGASMRVNPKFPLDI